MKLCTLLFLLLLAAGCAKGGVAMPLVSLPLPLLPPQPGVLDNYTPEPLAKCYGGDNLDSPGLYSNESWPFSVVACVMEARATKSPKMQVRANPHFSMEHSVDVEVTVVYTGEADLLHVGINGSGDYERLSSFPRRGSQSLVEWEDIPPGIYSIWAIATARNEQVAAADIKVCYGVGAEAC